MCFDVPKVVRSVGCDHLHDEESRNGRDIKIDILDDNVWTPEWFREVSDIYRSTGGYRNPSGTNGPCWALVERERGWPGQEARPLPLSPNRTRKGGAAPPLAFPLSHSFLPPPSWTRKGRGKPTWSRFPPPRARHPLGRPLLLPPFIYGGGGTSRHTS